MPLSLSMLWRGRIGKFILLGFAIILIIHLITLAIFAHANKNREFRLNYDFMARQVTQALNTLQQTNPQQLHRTISSLSIPNMSMSASNQPDSTLIVNLEAPIWQTQQRLSSQTPNKKISLSVYLPDGQWLNISATVVKTPWLFEITLLILELFVVVTILVSIWAIGRFTGPLKKFRHAAEQLGVDLNTKPLAVYGPSVVQDAAYAMNQMQNRIRDLLRHRMQMLAALSHDLRTPITRLKLRSHLIDDKDLQDKFNEDLDQIEAMVNETLTYVRAESHKEKKVELDLKALLESICDNYRDIGAPVTFDCQQQVMRYKGQPLALKRAFNNLIDNAIKYGGSADIHLSKASKRWKITIEDKGVGLDEQMKQKVFDPFFRGESSRSRDTGGTGLGLALVRDIIQAHGGEIRLEDVKPHGLRVRVLL